MRVFVSYRRGGWNGRPSALVRNVASGLQRPGLETVLDLAEVKDQREFATTLVAALNRCEAMVAIIDDAWLDQGNLNRLISSCSYVRSNDWVEFELRYAMRYGLAMAFVGERRCLERLCALKLPGPLDTLASQPFFETDDQALDPPTASDLAKGLVNRVRRGPPREPSAIPTPGSEENLPTALDEEAALLKFVGSPWLAHLLRRALVLLQSILFGVGSVSAVMTLGCVFSGAGGPAALGAAVTGVAAALSYLLRWARLHGIAWLLNGKLRREQRKPPYGTLM